MENYAMIKSFHTYRIITLGDSFTYGLYVPTEKNYSSKLEHLLNTQQCYGINQFEVINLGVWGYDLAYSAHRFFVRGLKYKPDLIIWFVNAWNFDTFNEKEIPMNQQYAIINSSDFFRELNIWKSWNRKKIMKYQQSYLKKMVNSFSGRLIIVSQGIGSDNQNIINEVIADKPEIFYFGGITNTWDKSELKVLDGHPNEYGHQAIANDLFKYLTETFFSNCK